MHVELADLFRCPVAHADGWLVLDAHRSESRAVVAGMLGCPTCGAEYAITDGVVEFGTPGDSPVADDASHAPDAPDAGAAAPELAMRMAALLDARDASVTIAFVGAPLTLVEAVQAIVPVRCIAVNAPDDHGAVLALTRAPAPLAVVRAPATALRPLPLAPWSLGGALVQVGDPESVVSAVRSNGRLVAPVHVPLPIGIVELARDAAHWVGEHVPESSATTSTAPASLVQLVRRR